MTKKTIYKNSPIIFRLIIKLIFLLWRPWSTFYIKIILFFSI